MREHRVSTEVCVPSATTGTPSETEKKPEEAKSEGLEFLNLSTRSLNQN